MHDPRESRSITARLGGVLVAPRATLEALSRGGARAGDVAWLIVARALIVGAPRLARAVVRGLEYGPMAALQGVLMTAQAVVPDVIGVTLAGMLMSLAVSRRRAPSGADAMDVAAYAYVPWLAIWIATAAYGAIAGAPLPEPASQVALAVGLGWGAAVWALGLAALRRARAEAA